LRAAAIIRPILYVPSPLAHNSAYDECAAFVGYLYTLLQPTGYNIAIGLTGDPVPFGIGNGATVQHEFPAIAQGRSAAASKSDRSIRWMPTIVTAKL
jgi:hypothetical protein